MIAPKMNLNELTKLVKRWHFTKIKYLIKQRTIFNDAIIYLYLVKFK